MTTREKRIAISFGVVLAGTVAVFSIPKARQEPATDPQSPASLIHRLQEMKTLTKSLDLWQERELWLDENTPVYSSGVVASSTVLERITKLFQTHNLKIVTQEIPQADEEDGEADEVSPHFSHVSVRVVSEGELQNMVECIHEIQTPANFTGVEQLSLSVAETGEYSLALLVTHWFILP